MMVCLFIVGGLVEGKGQTTDMRIYSVASLLDIAAAAIAGHV